LASVRFRGRSGRRHAEIDGTPIVTRTKAPEGHPFDEVLSGWLFRESETRDLSRIRLRIPA
jgi:sulfur-oxidizing protein SoxA